ncbi:MAG TPA: hypothetical protein VJB87_01195 [Candidatus Nanoarchaeia archaeon]|nr:hypothetical protein [Candidatus Nanoarchaeia archaeon]
MIPLSLKPPIILPEPTALRARMRQLTLQKLTESTFEEFARGVQQLFLVGKRVVSFTDINYDGNWQLDSSDNPEKTIRGMVINPSYLQITLWMDNDSISLLTRHEPSHQFVFDGEKELYIRDERMVGWSKQGNRYFLVSE